MEQQKRPYLLTKKSFLVIALLLLFTFFPTMISHSFTEKDLLKSIAIPDLTNHNPVYKEVIDLYKKGFLREKLGSYDNALLAYKGCLTKSLSVINNKKTTLSDIYRFLPFAIASAYRKGILTHRSIEGAVVKLYKQLEMYEDAEIWINEVLKSISNLMLERNLKISSTQFGMLYYSRAYNKAGWAFALFNGTLWKSYIIYSPQSVASLINRETDDLNTFMSFYNIQYNSDKEVFEKEVITSLSDYFDKLKNPSYENTTLILCYRSLDSTAIKSTMINQIGISAKRTIDYYKSDGVTKILEDSRKLHSFQDFQGEEAKEFVHVLAEGINNLQVP